MTTDRDFDRIAEAWLADGPEELSVRVLDAVVDEIHTTRQRHALRLPWRFPTMTMPVRAAAIVAVGALVVAGVAVLGGAGRGGPSPSQAPAASAPAAVVPSDAPSTILSTTGLPVLDTLFTSPRNGYSIKYPASWAVGPGTESWHLGKPILWGDPAMDSIQTSDARFVAAAQKLGDGQTADQWLKAYCLSSANDNGRCDSVPASWEPVTIASTAEGSGIKAYIDLDGVAAAGGTVVPGGKIFDAVAVNGNTAYAFTLDGDVDRPMFDAFLSNVHLYPGSLVSVPELTGTFTSPTYGYSVGTAPTWKPTPAEHPWVGVENESAAMDGIDITGTDTSFGITSQALGQQSYAGFLDAFHANTLKGVPAGCDGGDPSTWPSVQVGDQTGSLEQLCNAAEVLVHVGDRVYLFEWGNSTFEGDKHFSLASWEELLKSVTFDPASAK
jgi:hypothetical protein